MNSSASAADAARLDKTCVDAGTRLGMAMLETQLPPAVLEGLRGEGPYGLVLLVPTNEHATMVGSALDEIVEDPSCVFHIEHATGAIADALVEGLSQARIVVAIAVRADQLPTTFLALADDTVHMSPHDVRALRLTLRSVLQCQVPRFPRNFLLHPNPSLLCRCIRKGLPVRRVMKALVRLGETTRSNEDERIPLLEQAVEYGEVRTWGLQLKADLAAWRSGHIAAVDLDSGCLLSGPPGGGKSLFAKVLARSLDVPLLEMTMGSTFVGRAHLGEVLQEMRRRFAEAAAAAPCVLLIDEIDSISSRENEEHNSAFQVGVINELLALLDGIGRRYPGLIVVGSTNRPQAVDPALLRPGRLGRCIELSLPGAAGVENILRFQLRGDIARHSLKEVVRLAIGSTPAVLMDLVRTARRIARAEQRRLAVDDLRRAILGDGPEDSPKLMRIAVHESGHALACLLLPAAPVLDSVSLIQRDGMLGHVRSSEPMGASTRRRVEARIMMMLAGRAAETIVYGDDPSDGASGDLQMATAMLCEMHAQSGMGVSLLHHGDIDRLLSTDREFATRMDAELQRMLAEITAILSDFKKHIVCIASELYRRRVLSGHDAFDVLAAVDRALGLQAEKEELDAAAEMDDRAAWSSSSPQHLLRCRETGPSAHLVRYRTAPYRVMCP